ncbi:hypothetical protein TRVL_08588 [Trypanosoma vivax]|nr:hypothetical protein TRVL_08588 [Trypanosoma vivax]
MRLTAPTRCLHAQIVIRSLPSREALALLVSVRAVRFTTGGLRSRLARAGVFVFKYVFCLLRRAVPLGDTHKARCAHLVWQGQRHFKSICPNPCLFTFAEFKAAVPSHVPCRNTTGVLLKAILTRHVSRGFFHVE